MPSTKPVISVCATRTGTGKSQTTRYIADYLKKQGKKIAVVRHPMPYDQVLLNQRCQRYEVLDDLVKYNCTIEEREVSYNCIRSSLYIFYIYQVAFLIILHTQYLQT